MNVQVVDPKVFAEAKTRVPAADGRDKCRSEALAEDLTRVAQTERAIRAIERQRELAQRQGLARYD